MVQNRVIRPLAAMDAAVVGMAARASGEGFVFMQTLLDQWEDGSNRFDQPGEVYFGLRSGDRLIAAGGLNRDPYSADPASGRVRHVYVLPEDRRSGAGRELLGAIVSAARGSFSTLRLRTRTPEGAAFYESLGFERCDDPAATHVSKL